MTELMDDVVAGGCCTSRTTANSLLKDVMIVILTPGFRCQILSPHVVFLSDEDLYTKLQGNAVPTPPVS
jgi:hypothetical protein